MRFLIGLFVLAGVACSTAPPPRASSSLAPPATVQTFVPGSDTNDGGGPGRPSSSTSPDSSASPGTSGGSDGPAPPLTRDRSSRPPAAGLYLYDLQTTSTLNGERVAARSVVRARRNEPERVDGRWQQEETTRVGDATSRTIVTYRWTAAAIVRIASAQRSSGGTIDCTYDDPLTDLPLPPAVGDRWDSIAPTCRGRESRNASDSYRSRIVRAQTLTIGGLRVRTLLIDRRTTAGAGEGERLRTWFAPAYGLVVKQRFDEPASDGSTTVQVLRSVRPTA